MAPARGGAEGPERVTATSRDGAEGPERVTATIRDVAARAGVSTATVSRVLSGISPGRPRTRARVLDAARELDYRPSGVARSLKAGATRTLGLIVTDIGNPFFPELVRAIEDAAHEAGYALLLGNGADDPDRELAYLELLASRRVDGLVIASAAIPERHAAWLSRTTLPVVLVNCESADGSLPAVLSDDRGGGRQAAGHLLALGHRRLGLVTVADADAASRARENGVRDALAAAGLGRGGLLLARGTRGVSGGEAGMRALLRGRPRPTGVACHNDVMAIGAVRAALGAGLSVPDDVSVVGFDDIVLAAFVEPPLTTIRQETADLGRMGVERLVARLRGEDGGPTLMRGAAGAVRLPTRLVQRATTAPPPPRRSRRT